MMRSIKTGAVWVTIAYVVCYVGIALFPQLRETIIQSALHVNVGPVESVFTVGNFIMGLVFWNVLVAVGIWLWVFLSDKIKS